MSAPLDDVALDQLFRTARTQNAFLPKPVDATQLHALYELLKWGPTAANGTPARFVFVTSPDAKAKLAPALSAQNLDKTMAAPVTAIVGSDLDFHEQLPRLFPHTNAKAWFEGPQEARVEPALRNGSLQGAYLILAARALGLDAGPMSGFDAAKVDAAFFAGTSIRTNFLVNLGYGDPDGLFPRLPRLSFDEAARIE
ncbi:MAG: malonic semialdehyde reductase [Pseudoxanthomonas sp.]